MPKKQAFSDFASLNIWVYYEPITEAFNMYSFQGGVTSMTDIDTDEVFHEYVERFKDAWSELAKY